jgi:hypothetical protein
VGVLASTDGVVTSNLPVLVAIKALTTTREGTLADLPNRDGHRTTAPTQGDTVVAALALVIDARAAGIVWRH